MFQINSYLQFRNTPDSKPMVLTEGKDYILKSSSHLLSFENFQLPVISIGGFYNANSTEIAKLEDSKELVTIRLLGTGSHDFIWTEGDIFEYQYGGKFLFSLQEILTNFLVNYSPDTSNFDTSNKRIGSFFDDPAHYSKLLWNCSEEEGWQKVFDLLGIKS